MTLHDRDILFYAGGAAFEKYGTFLRRVQVPRFGGEELQETFTRTGQASYVDRDGVLRLAATDSLRPHYPLVDGVRVPHTLLEGARTQVATNPEAPNSWTSINTPVITTGQTGPFGASAILVEDNDGVTSEGKETAVSFTGDGTKVAVFAVRAGTLAVIRVGIRDTTAGVDRHQVTVTWNGGSTAPTVSTLLGAGTIYPSVLVADSAGTLWWLVRLSGENVVAANTNTLRALGGTTGGDTGTFYLAGGNAFDATFPSSWQGPTLGTRNADSLSAPFTAPPQSLAIFARLKRPVWADGNGDNGRQIVNIGDGATNTVQIKSLAGPSRWRAFAQAGAGDPAADKGAAIAVGDPLDVLVELDNSTATGMRVRMDVGAGFGTWTSAVPRISAWNAETIRIGALSAGSFELFGALRALIVARGTGYVADDFRAWLP